AEDDVDPGRLLHDGVPVLLGHASADGDLQAGMVLLDLRELAEVAVETVVGVLAHGTGVEDDDIGLVVAVRLNVAGIVEESGETLGVVHVHLTSVGLDLVAARCGLGHRRGVNQFSHRGTILAVPSLEAAPDERVTNREPGSTLMRSGESVTTASRSVLGKHFSSDPDADIRGEAATGEH